MDLKKLIGFKIVDVVKREVSGKNGLVIERNGIMLLLETYNELDFEVSDLTNRKE